MICPTCDGERGTIVVACGSQGCRVRAMPCSTCDGTGAVDDRYPAWKLQGKLCKDWRCRSVYRNFWQIGELTGLDVVAISRMERGLNDPAPLLALLETEASQG